MSEQRQDVEALVAAVRKAIELTAAAKEATGARNQALDDLRTLLGGGGDLISAIFNGQRRIGQLMTEHKRS